MGISQPPFEHRAWFGNVATSLPDISMDGWHRSVGGNLALTCMDMSAQGAVRL